MTGDKFRARADASIKAAHAVADPVRKLAPMDVAERWLRLAAQIDGAAAFPASRTCDAPELAPQVPIPCQPAAVGTAMVPK